MDYQPKLSTSPTMMDVARLAGVSVATVSRVLNKHPSVTEATQEKVSSACDLLGYTRNPFAAALRTGSSNMVSIFVADLAVPWYSKVTNALKHRLQLLEYEAAVHDLKGPSDSPFDLSQLPGAISRINPRQNRGVILSLGGMIDSPDIIQSLYLLSERVPLIVMGQPIKNAPWATVTFLDREVAFEVTDYLRAQGRRRVAFLGKSPTSYFAGELQKGYSDAVRAGGSYDAELVWSVDGNGFQYGYDTIRGKLERGVAFDGILATNDDLAIGAMRALNERGIEVPAEVAVVGFGGSDAAAYLPATTLTSVAGPVEETAVRVTSSLIDMINGEQVEPIQYMRRELIVRESTEPE